MRGVLSHRGRQPRNAPWRRRAHTAQLDPLRGEAISNPDSTYRRLHEHGGAYHCAHRDLWVIASYDHVRSALREHAVFSSAEGITQMRSTLPIMICMDEPEHARLRRLVAPYFTAEAASRARPLIEQVAHECLNRMLEPPSCDAVAELAIPLPVRVIAAQLGIPGSDFAHFRAWSDGIVRGFNGGPPLRTIGATGQVLHGVHALHRYMRGQLSKRSGADSQDVLSLLVERTRRGELTQDELFWFVLLLLVAGNETTTNLVGSMLLALAGQPDTYDALRSDRSLVPSAVAEALRWSSPLQNLFRTTLSDHDLGECSIPAGARVMLSYAAANRDPRHYPDPDRFIAGREPADHLAFGGGIHFCLGAHLARLEATVVLEVLLERVRRIELSGTPKWSANIALRGPTSLPLRLTPA